MRVELHVHTNYSYDCDILLQDLIAKCTKEKIDAIAITDHNEIEGALRLKEFAPFKVIVGEEILTSEGEVIGLFLKRFIKPGQSLSKTINEIKKQGGLVYIPHPFDRVTRKTAVYVEALAAVTDKIDIIESVNGRTLLEKDNQLATLSAQILNKSKGVGSDAHTLEELGRNVLLMDDFTGPKEFLKSLTYAKLETKRPRYTSFIRTKYVRRKKKLFAKLPKKLSVEPFCNICGGRKVSVLYAAKGKAKPNYFISDSDYGVHGRIVKCLACGLVFTNPRLSHEELIERYGGFKDIIYEQERQARVENYKSIAKRLLKKKGDKLLDVGSATGAMVEAAERIGFAAEGIEPSKWASKLAREKHGLEVTTGVLNTKVPSGAFSAVSCLDVIEHVANPSYLLSQISRVLKQGGVLGLVTPDWNSLARRGLGEKWWHVRPDHIYYFDLQTLRSLLAKAGFEIILTKRFNWRFSLAYWLSRFESFAPQIYKSARSLQKQTWLGTIADRSIQVNLYDSWEIYAKKRKTKHRFY